MSEVLSDERWLSASMLRHRRVALFLFGVALFYAGLCLLIIYKISVVAATNNTTFSALVNEWMMRVDVGKQYSGSSVLGFELLSKLANDAVICGFLALFGWLMWKRAKFYATMREALHAAILEASDETRSGSAQPIAPPDGGVPPVS